MKVSELIEALQKENPDAEVMIRDADTDWLLPAHFGDSPYAYMGKDPAENQVLIYCTYDEAP